MVLLSTLGVVASDIAAQSLLRTYLTQEVDNELLSVAGGSIPRLERAGIESDDDDFDGEEFEKIEDEAIEGAVLATSIPELERELAELLILEASALQLKASGVDRKWSELRTIMQSEEFHAGAKAGSEDRDLGTNDSPLSP